jgi:hypothetical protein
MHCNRKLIITLSMFVLVLLCGPFFAGEAQENQTRLAHANGKGMLRVGDEQFKISSAIVKLLPDHTAEITIVSDITIFLTATWSNTTDSAHQFNLEFAGGASRGGVEGTGQASLSDDGKTLKRLSLKGVSRATKRAVEANFEGR